MTRKEKIADSFNTLYRKVVNNKEVNIANDANFYIARDFINTHYPMLDLAVMEFLAVYMLHNPKGKVQFQQSDKDVLDLWCVDEKTLRVITFNYDGIIVKDESREMIQKGE